jgi:RNA polymerase sigma factor (sigma-70 family)
MSLGERASRLGAAPENGTIAVIRRRPSGHSSSDTRRAERDEMTTPPEQDLEELHPASFGWALLCCGWDRQEAEEVLQETYLKVLCASAVFDGRSSLKTWLFGVIRKTAAERRRRRWVRAIALKRWLGGQPDPPSPEDPESTARACEDREALHRALRALPARQRELLHLVFYQDLTVEEASRVLGISAGTARTHYHRGKERLRERLAAEVGS